MCRRDRSATAIFTVIHGVLLRPLPYPDGECFVSLYGVKTTDCQRGHVTADAIGRARETAIRVALGGSRRQLALRYFAEGALVSVADAAVGVGLSVILVRYILTAASAFIARGDDITIAWTVLGFSVAVAVPPPWSRLWPRTDAENGPIAN